MANYIDGFAFPIPHKQLETYREAVEKIAVIWKEHGALEYFEYVSDNSDLEGTRSFTETVDAKEKEVVIFRWVSFESREARDLVNKRVAADPRMTGLMDPLTNTPNPIFDVERMAYGGFRSFVSSSDKGTV